MSRATELAVLRPPPVKDGDEAPTGSRAQPLSSDAIAEHPEFGLTPRRAQAIFRMAEEGWPRDQCNLLTGVIRRNATARQLFEGRRAAVAGKDWTITPDGTEGDSELAARVLEEVHRRLPMRKTFDHQLTFNCFGYAPTELDWGLQVIDGRTFTVPTALTNVPQRRFRIDPKTDDLHLLTEERPVEGEALVPGKWWVTDMPEGRRASAGLGITAAWLTLWISYALRDVLVKSERYGIPLPLVTYDPTVEDAGKAVAIEIVRRIGTDGGAAVPKDVKVDLVQIKGGAGDFHSFVMEYCNRELAKLIVGGTLSNDNAQPGAGGSYAQASVHALGRFELVQGDANLLQDSWQQQVAVPFMRFNGLAGRAPLLRIQVAHDQTPEGQVKAADTLKNRLGVPVSVSQLRQITGLRAPLGDADAAPGPATPAAPSAGGAA